MMIQTQVKKQLNTIIDLLPEEQAELVLDFALLLRQRQSEPLSSDRLNSATTSTEWETALADAEDYWFQLPESVRTQYSEQTVALLRDRILDADTQLNALRKRVTLQYPDQPVLYLDADAEPAPPLFVRSPRLR